MTGERARLDTMRRHLGAQLAAYRIAAVISQPQLGQALDRTRSTISKIEHGVRTMPAALWAIADELCGAQGALVAEYEALATAEQDYRDRCRAHHRQRQIQQAGAQAHRQAPSAWPEPVPGSPPAALLGGGGDAWPDTALASAGLGLAEELLHVVTQLIQILGRRDAMRLVSGTLTAAGLWGLDPDEYTRLAHAVQAPRRVDAHVINNLAVTLAYCKRLEDTLGPCQVLDTVTAQHRLVHRLLDGDCPDNLVKPLTLVDSTMASTIGGYLIDMGHSDQAKSYFEHARKAAHDAGNTVYAAYAAAYTSFAAFMLADTPTALDSAAAARSLAARTDDPRLKALVEQTAAAAYTLDGQHGPSMIACDRAHDMLVTARGSARESPAYYLHHGSIDSTRSLLLSRLNRPSHALDAAIAAQAHYDQTQCRYAMCQVRLGHALVLSKDIDEAARILGDTANQAHLYPRLTQELHTARAVMQPWASTQAVATLDAQLEACGLLPATTLGPENRWDRHT